MIIPPQSVTAWSGTGSLANTYLAVICKVSENDNYVVGSSSATGTVYVPMDKTLNKGEDNSVNLVFGTLTDGKRSYGRDDKGNRIIVSETKTISEITSADLGKVICTDGTIYNTVAEATIAGKTVAGMIAYVSSTGHGIAIALTDAHSGTATWSNAVTYAANYTPTVSGYSWKLPSANDWDHMFASFGGTAYSGSEHSFGETWMYGNFRSKLTECGGTDVQESRYWSSTEYNSNYAYYYSFYDLCWNDFRKRKVCYVRSCLAF